MKYSKEVGAICLIVGTCVGAGMLAIPLVTFQFGFLLFLLAILLCWAIMLKMAFVIIDLNYQFPTGTNFQVMANHLLGPLGRVVTWISFVCVMYAAITAYIMAGSSALLAYLGSFYREGATNMTGGSSEFETLLSAPALTHSLAVGAFMVVLTPLVYMGTGWVDKGNRILLGIKFLFFGLAVQFLLTEIHWDYYRGFHLHGAETVLPVLVVSFTYQQVLPVIRSYLDCSKKKLKVLAAIGSAIPLAIYILWQTAVIGTFPKEGPDGLLSITQHDGNAGLFLVDYNKIMSTPYFAVCIGVFYNIAVTTSFLAVSLALFHFNQDTYHLKNRKPLNYLITFGIPIFMVAMFHNDFSFAVSCAGMFAAILVIVIPCCMVRATTLGAAQSKNAASSLGLWGLLIFGLSVAGVQILRMATILPA